MTASSEIPRIDLDQPRWDQSTFLGRLKHFANLTDMRTVLSSDAKLNEAKDLVTKYRLGAAPPGTTEEQLWYAKKLYDSAFHPDSGELQNMIGRMSFQVPGGMLITGFMMQFYRTIPAVVFWQWINQSFNALVNYTNRNAASAITTKQIGTAYVSATTAAVAVSVGLNSLTSKAPQLMRRWVPFAAVAAGNFANIPLMRQRELMNGIVVTDGNGNELGKSKKAATKGIFQVFVSRVSMAAPGMLFCPIIMQRLERYTWMQRIQFLHGPIQVMLVGCFLVFMVPTACALFPQRASLSVEKLEPDLRASIQERYGDKIKTVYFNKGL
ncbi:SFXN2 [Branchiostoma lanceolatum]|uniref:Sidoreflexin n=1 Tax=Branchiostoma lanceolatum TaxID=7740 RepID=A0A8J9ZPF4_BRALA|nr:SFXN2 [Branchiostoma lanceolatum]